MVSVSIYVNPTLTLTCCYVGLADIFSKFRRAHAFMLPEDPVEMTFVCKVEFIGNFIDPHIAVPEPHLNQPQFVVDKVLLKCFAGLLFKITPKVMQ